MVIIMKLRHNLFVFIYLLMLTITMIGCNTNYKELSDDEVNLLYDDVSKELINIKNLDMDNYDISYLEDIDGLLKESYPKDEYEELKDVLLKAYHREDIERASPSIIFMNKNLKEIIIGCFDENGNAVYTILNDNGVEWIVSTVIE